MKDRNGPATIPRCKETGKCQFIDVINIFQFTVSLYIAGTFVCYILPQAHGAWISFPPPPFPLLPPFFKIFI